MLLHALQTGTSMFSYVNYTFGYATYVYVWVGNASLLCVRVCLWGHLLCRYIDGHAGPKGHTGGRGMIVCVGQTSNPFLLMNKMWCRVDNERGGRRNDTCCTPGSVSDAVDKLFMDVAHAKRRCVMPAVLGPSGDHVRAHSHSNIPV